MPFFLEKNDITKMEVDAIVNAANATLLGGGGVDGAIHAAAGPELLEECRALNGCQTGEAKLTKGYGLPAKYVIHTVGPIYRDGLHQEEELLRKSYRSSLSIATEQGFSSVAFPLISGGAYGYPKAEALRIAEEELSQFAELHDEVTVYLVLYSRDDFSLSDSLKDDVKRYFQALSAIENPEISHFCKVNTTFYEKLDMSQFLSIDTMSAESAEPKKKRPRKKKESFPQSGFCVKEDAEEYAEPEAACPEDAAECSSDTKKHRKRAENQGAKAARPSSPFLGCSGKISLNLDESFQKTLFRLIDEKGMTDPQCYHRANIDKREFSRIRSKEHYQPSKTTACAFVIALSLTLPEAQDFLRKAGLCLSDSFLFDKIIMYCLENQIFDYMKVNELLFHYDQPTLGTRFLDK